jgi:hypothetical protein
VRKEELFETILRAADRVGATHWVVIGSQAAHGALPNVHISRVERSDDADAFPTEYAEWMYEALHHELGFDSGFNLEKGYYFEVVRPTMPRFPDGWEQRITIETIGEVNVRGENRSVTVGFPDLHDVIAAKLCVKRPRDTAFFRQLYRIGVIEQDLLLQRMANVPKRTEEQVRKGNAAASYVRAFYAWQERLAERKRRQDQ